MGMLSSYLKRHIKIIIMLIVFIGVFALVFSLYELPVEAVLYAGVLCLCIGAFLFFVGYWREVSRHRALSGMLSRVSVSIEDLPSPSGILEQDYQALIKALFKEKSHVQCEADITQQELIDYYTLWVHQIKTPIAAMRLILQMGANDQNAALSMELFKIEQYVDMVLQYLHLESSASDFLIRTCALDSIVRQSVRKYAKLFILKKISFNFKESGLSVLTDEKWLSFVIEQILSNALKYTHSGMVSIYTAGTALVIEDTGIGVKAEDLPRVFEKGFTGYNGREDKKSTGVGLYLCRRILDKLSHTISIESEAGRGTRVIICLETPNIIIE